MYEMLALSSTSQPDELSNIVESTAAVIFLGTPHRGSPDLSALGAWARSVLSGLRFVTTSAILDTLGLKTTDLERSQEAFSGLWLKYGFLVKTFQEGYGMTKINLGVLGNKVVPDTSSLIGDQREHAETLQANHMEMCRFSGREDPNFVKVVGELRSAYLAISTGTIRGNTNEPFAFNSTIKVIQPHYIFKGRIEATSGNSIMSNAAGREELTTQQTACLKSIQFPHMHRRRQIIEDPAPRTGRWLIENKIYSHWLFERDIQEQPCILWLKGNPGAGKSTLMKQAFRHAKLSLNASEYCVAGVFVSAKGEPLEHSSIGVFRSLLHQLLPHYPVQLQEAVQTWKELEEEAEMSEQSGVIWRAAELKSLLNSILGHAAGKRTIIYIDGLDELGLSESRRHAEFWGKLSRAENSGRVRVCLSSRHYPQISFSSVSELVAEHLNEADISTYIKQRLTARIVKSESHWEPKLRIKLIRKARGIFLWVTLTLDSLLVKYDQGKSLELLLRHIDLMPWELELLFRDVVISIGPESRAVTLQTFQWALMSTTPLRLHQWHHVLAFIKKPSPKSLDEWRKSVNYTESDSQLEREIKALSGGLLQVSAARSDEVPGEDQEYLSIRAGAGSLDQEEGETRIVQVIHSSVRDFFLEGDGFRLLDHSAALDPTTSCHITIVMTCLDYICISELDHLVSARRSVREKEAALFPEWVPSEMTGPAKSLIIGEDECSPTPEERDLEQDPTDGRQETFAEHLSMLSMTDLRTSIARWIATGNIPTNPTSSAASTRYAKSILSAANVSCQLEDWPSLLFYITSSLATHLRATLRIVIGSAVLGSRLDDEELWTRFVLLKEDIPWGTTLSGFVYGQEDVSLARSMSSLPSSSAFERRLRSRASSVGSFTSASSYAKRRRNRSH